MKFEEKIQEVNLKKLKMDNVFNQIIQSSSFRRIVEEYCNIPYDELPEFIFAGIGKNWYICQKVVKTFISMGIQAQALDCGHALHGDLGMMTTKKQKVVFFISKSGSTKELVDVAKIIRHFSNDGIFKCVKLICFFLNKDVPNRDLYDYAIIPDDPKCLEVVCEFDERNLVPSFSIDVTQLVLDLLGVIIYESHQELVDKYVYNHLSGANGEKLGGPNIIKGII